MAMGGVTERTNIISHEDEHQEERHENLNAIERSAHNAGIERDWRAAETTLGVRRSRSAGTIPI
jgi:hypothetical protein